MKKILTFGLMVLLVMALGVAGAKPEYKADEVIVKLKGNVDIAADPVTSPTGISSIDSLSSKRKVVSIEKVLDKSNIKNQRAWSSFEKHGIDRVYLIKTHKNLDINEAVREMNNDPEIEYAEPNYIYHIDAIPNDPGFSILYGLHNTGQTGGTADADMDAAEAWDIQTGSSDVVIAVIDTGVNYKHEDLSSNVWTNPGEIAGNGVDDDLNGYIDDTIGWDFANSDNDPFDDNGHGTHVAGTIGAAGNNNKGVVGVNWNVRLMPLKFLDLGGSGSTANAINAINYATRMGVDVMSNSWGGFGFSQALMDTISAANDAGILFVAAAGNNGGNNDANPFFPASYDVPNVVSVAATDHSDSKAGFSNFGSVSVDLGAPGVKIFSTLPNGTCANCNSTGYGYLSGTSMAAPQVSGAAGLIKAQFPSLTSNEIKTRLLGSVDITPSLEAVTVTGGRLNALNSLEADSAPPSAVANLAVIDSATTSDSVTLAWTASGDDGNSGTAKSYDVRYSASPINDINWGAASKALNEPRPKSAGSAETFTVTNLVENTTYHFALKVIDNVGNPSGLSNDVFGSTKTILALFRDDMENGVNGWTADGLWHQETQRSNSPSNSWAYNNGSPNFNYDTGSRNFGRLTSKFIDLSDSNTALLRFKYLYQTESSTLNFDQRFVQIGVNGVFTNLVQLGGEPMWVWNDFTMNISQYAHNSNVQVRFFFDTVDNMFNSFEGWYIDDVAIIGDGTPQDNNNAPVANANGPYQGNVNVPLAFDGSGSSDPDGDSLTYNWNFGDGSTGIGISPSHVYTSAGIFAVSLIVNDGKLNSTPSTTQANITPQQTNNPPVANAGPDQNVISGTLVALDGTGSSDLDGDTLTFQWEESAGNPAIGLLSNPNSASPTFTPSIAGSYSFTLTVNDGQGGSDLDSVLITVNNASEEPICTAEADVQALISNASAPPKSLAYLKKALPFISNACSQIKALDVVNSFKNVKSGVVNLESAAKLGASSSGVIQNLRNNVQDITNSKIDEAVLKVCNTQLNVKTAIANYNKAVATVKSSMAIGTFTTAYQNAQKGIATKVDLTGDWAGTLKQGTKLNVQVTAVLVQDNTVITGTFNDSLGRSGTVSGDICGKSISAFSWEFSSGFAAGTAKSSALGNKINFINLKGADSGVPIKLTGTLTKQ